LLRGNTRSTHSRRSDGLWTHSDVLKQIQSRGVKIELKEAQETRIEIATISTSEIGETLRQLGIKP